MEEVETRRIDNVIFKRIGADVNVLTGSGFSSEGLPIRGLVVSNRFGYTFIGHSQGFSVVKTSELVQLAIERKSKAAVKPLTEIAAVNVSVPKLRILALSGDDLTLSACFGASIALHDVPTLIRKAEASPMEIRALDSNSPVHTVDFCWSPSDSSKYMILSSQGELLSGCIGSILERKVKSKVLAASWSPDGKHLAYVTDVSGLTISTSDFSNPFILELPTNFSEEDILVDTLRWVRADSMLVGFVRVNAEGEEDENPLFLLSCKSGNFLQKDCIVTGSIFYGLFPSIASFIVPTGSGPYMLSEYLKPWDMVVAASRKSIDDHIVLVGWFSQDNTEDAFNIELGNDSWIPRIELQENGDDNAIVGLAIDCTTVQVQLSDPRDDSGDVKLPACPVLICTTLEGRLILFSFARLSENHVPGIVNSPSHVPEVKPKPTEVFEKGTTEKKIAQSIVPFSGREKMIQGLEDERSMSRTPKASLTDHTHEKKETINSSTIEMNKSKERASVGFVSSTELSLSVARTGPANSNVMSRSSMTAFAGPLTTISKAIPPSSQRVVDNVRPSSPLQSWSVREQPPPGRPPGVSDMESTFIMELEKVRRMATEVDHLMCSIEGRPEKGNSSSYITFTKESVEDLEHRIEMFSEDCSSHKKQLNKNSQLLEEMRYEILRVDALRIYGQSLTEQRGDGEHQEVWACQKLHPELDSNRKRILKADQELKLHIAELERHLHSLELKQWQQDSLQRRSYKQVHSPGQFLSVQNLYNTVNAQMVVAEELANVLAQQMAVLESNIGALKNDSAQPSAQAILKYVGADNRPTVGSTQSNYSYPRQQSTYSPKSRRDSSDSEKLAMSVAGVGTQETSRRRRDSMDVAWVDRGPPTTTIKRALRSNPVPKYASSDLGMALSHGKSILNKVTEKEPLSQPEQVQLVPTSRSTPSSTSSTLSYMPNERAALETKCRAHDSNNLKPRLEERLLAKSSSSSQTDSSKLFVGVKSHNNGVLESENEPVVKEKQALKREVLDRPGEALHPTKHSSEKPSVVNNRTSSINPFSLNGSDSSKLVTMVQSFASQSLPAHFASGTAPSKLLDSSTKGLDTSHQLRPTKLKSPTPSPTVSVSNIISPTGAGTTPRTLTSSTPVINPPPISIPIPMPNSGPSFSTSLNVGQFSVSSSVGGLSGMTSSPSVSPASFASPSASVFSTVPSPTIGQTNMWQSSQEASQQPSQQSHSQFIFPASHSSPSTNSSAPLAESNEEDMEEESTTTLGSFSGFGGLGLGESAPLSSQKTNPFGGSAFGNSSMTLNPSPTAGGQLFRPAAFSLPTAQPSTAQSGSNVFGNSFGTAGFAPGGLFTTGDTGKGFGNPSQPIASGFGQPAQLGPAQQALGTALGAFGQTRQVGFGSNFGVGMSSTTGGGFANAATGSGFPNMGGFASASLGGAFASAATGGGFASAATGGGFAGVGFAGSAGGGFQAFSTNQSTSPAFGSGIPGAQGLFTQMRK